MPLDLFAEETQPLDLFADEMPAKPTPKARHLALMVKPEKESFINPEFKRDFIETTKGLGRLAKQPMGIIEGAIQFATSLPGFGAGVIKGTQNILESLQRPTNMSDLYDAFMEGLEQGAKGMEATVYKPHIPEAELVGKTAMVPWTGAQMALNKLADDPIYDDYPNLKGYLKFAGFVGGAKFMKQLYHPKLSKGMVKNITDVSEQAMKMRESYELVRDMPDSPLKTLRLKELGIRERSIRERLAIIENKIQRPKTAEELGIKRVKREVPEITKRLEGKVPYKAKIGLKPKGEAAEIGLAKDIGKVYQAIPKEVGAGVPVYEKVEGKTVRRPPLFEFKKEAGLTLEDKLRAKLRGTGKEIQKLQIEKEPIDLFKEEVKPAEKPTQATLKAKEPWEMTREEYIDYYATPDIIEGKAVLRQPPEAGHKHAVKIAIKEGKITSHPDYPELGKVAPKVEPKEVIKPEELKPVKAILAEEAKIGDSIQIMGVDATIAKTKTIEGIRYDLLNASKLKDKRGFIHIYDSESGNVIGVTEFSTYDAAEAKYSKDVGYAEKAEVKPSQPTLIEKEAPKVAPKGKLVILKDKQKLLADIDKAIEEAPLLERTEVQPEMIKFDIDGGAYIWNQKAVLEEFRNRIARTPENKPIKITLPGYPKLPRPTGKPVELGLGETVKYGKPSEITLETFGFQTVYEKASDWIKAAKEGRETKVREAVEEMRKDYLKVVEGSPLDRAAVNYLKSEKYSDYLKGMPSIGELKPSEIFKYDPAAKKMIAGYSTKEGKLKPAIRQSGYYALKEFADAFDKSMDIGKLTASWTDPTRMIQELDGGKWAGMAQKHILWPTRMTTQAKLRWADHHKATLSKIFEDHKITSGKKRKTVGDILEYIDKERLNVSAKELAETKEIKGYLKGYKDRTQIVMIEGTKKLRKLLNQLFNEQNQARRLRGQKEIPYRQFYRTWIIETNLWSKLLGQKVRPKEIMESPEMPDFINPNQPFNPRAEARTGLLAKYTKERDMGILLSDYIETAAKDIFDTNIVHNNKIHSAVLRSKGLENAANAIDIWTSEAYAGVNPRLTRWAKETIPPTIRGGVLKIRRNLTRAVFPLNWTWNAFIQTSSAGITYARYGNKANLAGLEYLINPILRRAIKQNAYSSMIKSRWGGRTHYQDIQNSILKNKRLDTKPIERVEDYANFLTSSIEDALTGHAVAAAYYDGKVRLKLKGRELWEYASEGGAKTQSMYNYQDLPGLLRAREVGAVAPFQTFAFEVFNTVREMNVPVVRRIIGRTGLYETMTADSIAGKALLSKRLMMVGRWTAAIVVTNAVVEKVIGRKPWILSSFIPFIGYILGGTIITGYPGRGPDFTPKEYIDDFRNGIRDVLVYEDFIKLRKWILRYHLIAGIQIERTIEGIEAIAKGGRVKDVRGRLMYKMEPNEYWKALTMGPSRTEAAKTYYEKKEKGSSLLEKLKTKLKPSKITAVAG